MTDLLDEAFHVVTAKGPNAELIAKLGCELERAHAKNYRLDAENRNIRRSYSRLKKFFTRQFKYFKAHRDELLNEKNKIRNKMDRPALSESITARYQESGFRYSRRCGRLLSPEISINVVFNSDKEQNSVDTRCAGGT